MHRRRHRLRCCGSLAAAGGRQGGRGARHRRRRVGPVAAARHAPRRGPDPVDPETEHQRLAKQSLVEAGYGTGAGAAHRRAGPRGAPAAVGRRDDLVFCDATCGPRTPDYLAAALPLLRPVAWSSSREPSGTAGSRTRRLATARRWPCASSPAGSATRAPHAGAAAARCRPARRRPGVTRPRPRPRRHCRPPAPLRGRRGRRRRRPGVGTGRRLSCRCRAGRRSDRC